MIRLRIINGLCIFGRIPRTKQYIDIQLFSFVRNFSDGITFFKLNLYINLWEDKHNPEIGFELTIFNCYNMIMFHR